MYVAIANVVACFAAFIIEVDLTLANLDIFILSYLPSTLRILNRIVVDSITTEFYPLTLI